jgi:hypothetical protein
MSTVKIKIEPEELARRYRDGESLEDFGVLCHCTGTRIRTILAALGIEIRRAGLILRHPTEQVPAPLGVTAGVMKVDTGGEFRSWRSMRIPRPFETAFVLPECQ